MLSQIVYFLKQSSLSSYARTNVICNDLKNKNNYLGLFGKKKNQKKISLVKIIYREPIDAFYYVAWHFNWTNPNQYKKSRASPC